MSDLTSSVALVSDFFLIRSFNSKLIEFNLSIFFYFIISEKDLPVFMVSFVELLCFHFQKKEKTSLRISLSATPISTSLMFYVVILRLG